MCKKDFYKQGFDECEIRTPPYSSSRCAKCSHNGIAHSTILTLISSGELIPIQYLHGDPLNHASEWDAQNFAFNGWSQFWNATFGILLNWVFDFNDLMPLIGGPNDLSAVYNFDPSTWTIPSYSTDYEFWSL